MEEQSLQQKLVIFLKENLLIVGILVISVLLLGIGLIQIVSTSSSSSEITYVPSESNDSVESNSKSDSSSKILIDVSGAVGKPGVYELSDNSRLKDAILKAGGFLDNADKEYISKTINLAQKLTDGEKIYVPFRGEEISVVLGSTTGKINVNKATKSELESLAGVGPVTAEKIIKARPYSSLEDLVNKKAISKSVFEKVKDEIRL